MYWKKRKFLYKKKVQLPQDWFGTPTGNIAAIVLGHLYGGRDVICLSGYTRNLTKLRRRWQRERQKEESNRFNEQNNNSARASPFFCTFLFAVPAQLGREMTKF